MFLLLLLAPAILGLLTATPIIRETLSLSFAPESAMVINQAQVQLFRAPLCQGMYVDSWSFELKAFMMNVQWDSREIGDSNWLRIRISNTQDMTKVVCDNSDTSGDPAAGCGPFTYDKKTWGSDDLYIEVTASVGSPTYQYGLNLVANHQDHSATKSPDAMSIAKDTVGNKMLRTLEIETLEQVATPFVSELVTGETGQYMIPYCFETTHPQRKLSATTLVPDNLNSGAGGVASYFCTSGMMRNGECYRSIVRKRGIEFYDASGAKINTITPIVKKEEYGPVYLLVLAQGDWHKKIDFTITTKLRHAEEQPTMQMSGDHEEDVRTVVSYLRERIEGKSRDEVPEKEEL